MNISDKINKRINKKGCRFYMYINDNNNIDIFHTSQMMVVSSTLLFAFLVDFN